MMLFLLSILLAYWFQKEMQHFPTRINQQTYQDYHLLVQSPLSLADFIHKSTLQPKFTFLSYGFYILFPVIVWIFYDINLPLIFILICLIYLSLLDYLYYLTDIRYVSIIFILALWQLLFYHSLELNSHIFSLFITILFFSLFSLLSQLIYKKESLGLGDILLFIALSPLFTLEEMILLLLYASLFGLAFYALYFLFTKQKLARLPFIPFISLSTLWGIIGKI